jgi:hypothetical protein
LFVLGAMEILPSVFVCLWIVAPASGASATPLGSRFRERRATRLESVDLTQGVSRAHFDRFTEAAGIHGVVLPGCEPRQIGRVDR